MAAKARRVWRKAERATRARGGGNHSRVCRRMSEPLAGWRERARHDILRSDLTGLLGVIQGSN